MVKLAAGQAWRSPTPQRRPVELQIGETGLTLKGWAWLNSDRQNGTTVQIEFEALTTAQSRQLIELLYCRPGQWQRRTTPNELHSLWLIGKTLVCPPILSAKSNPIRAIAQG